MEELMNLIANAEGLYDLGSVIKMFVLMIGFDGVIGIIYAIIKGSSGK